MSGPLAGKVAIVTGSGRGIGRAVASAYCQAGARVIVNDVDQDAVDAVVAELRQAGAEAAGRQAEVGGTEAGEQLVAAALENFGRLDIMVNNAGILRDRMLHNMTEDEFDSVIRVNLRGTWACTRAAVAYWRPLAKAADRDGTPEVRKVINVTSASGLTGAVGQSNYAAAKMGVVGLTKAWAKELGPLGIRVNAIAPLARTRLTEPLLADPEQAAARAARLALRRYGEVEDVVPVFLFLASSASDFITGQVINADGGLVI
ncbi:MAG TPA: glucose 1-dehydrogenase [Anaerolineales bacterium]